MAYGNAGFGGSLASANYWMDANPTAGRIPDAAARARAQQAQDFAHDSTYSLPDGRMVTHVMDPYGGEIRMLLINQTPEPVRTFPMTALRLRAMQRDRD